MNFRTKSKDSILGIDATNIRSGGGITHIIELLAQFDPEKHNFKKIIIWGSPKTLSLIKEHECIEKKSPLALNKNLLQRTLWQLFQLPAQAIKHNCTILFIPGGSYRANFFPVVTMSQNLLPFEFRELKRFGFSLKGFKLLLLRFTQSSSFKRSNGVIFLTEYARKTVNQVSKKIQGSTQIIPHGINLRFKLSPKPQNDIKHYNVKNPYRILYVSIIDQYKHQWHVVDAVSKLRKNDLPVVLDLIGPSYAPALKKLSNKIKELDPKNEWAFYHGPIPFHDLHSYYKKADLGLFASSCENLPNILIELMAAGLPIACSNKGPMPEVLKENGLYFDPEEPEMIAEQLSRLIHDPLLRGALAKSSFRECENYTWDGCANETFGFLSMIEKCFYKSI